MTDDRAAELAHKYRLDPCGKFLGHVGDDIRELIEEVESCHNKLRGKAYRASVVEWLDDQKELTRLRRVDKAARIAASQSHRDPRAPHMDHVPATTINALKRLLP